MTWLFWRQLALWKWQLFDLPAKMQKNPAFFETT
jgi:hypothetical protein